MTARPHEDPHASEPDSQSARVHADPHAAFLASLPASTTAHYAGYDPGRAAPEFEQDAFSTWEEQTAPYPADGPPGLSDLVTDLTPYGWAGQEVRTLLWRDDAGKIRGWLDYYPQGMEPYNSAGQVDMQVHPSSRGQGIAKALLTEATRRWPIRVEDQRFSPQGAAVVNRYVEFRVARRESLQASTQADSLQVRQPARTTEGDPR